MRYKHYGLRLRANLVRLLLLPPRPTQILMSILIFGFFECMVSVSLRMFHSSFKRNESYIALRLTRLTVKNAQSFLVALAFVSSQLNISPFSCVFSQRITIP